MFRRGIIHCVPHLISTLWPNDSLNHLNEAYRSAVLLDSRHEVVPSLCYCIQPSPHFVRSRSVALFESSDQFTTQLGQPYEGVVLGLESSFSTLQFSHLKGLRRRTGGEPKRVSRYLFGDLFWLVQMMCRLQPKEFLKNFGEEPKTLDVHI